MTLQPFAFRRLGVQAHARAPQERTTFCLPCGSSELQTGSRRRHVTGVLWHRPASRPADSGSFAHADKEAFLLWHAKKYSHVAQSIKPNLAQVKDVWELRPAAAPGP